jgi:hypothetical protein
MSRTALLWLALAALVAAPGVVRSGADFTAGSASPANAFAATTDFNTVAVTATDPGTPLRGTVELQSVAASERGIDRVRYESSPAGAGTWTTACQATAAPFTCQWDTASVSGSHDLRAVAIDLAGYERSSAIVASRMVDNTQPSVSLADPDAWLEGTETLSVSGADAHSGLASLAIEYRPAGGAWVQLCTDSASPSACPLDTGGLPDGAYELRARATDQAGNEAVGAPVTRAVDNVAPTVSIQPPAGVLRGTAAFPPTAADAGTGIASVTLELRPSGGGPWSAICVDQEPSHACSSVDTTLIPDDLYEARAIALDGAGHSTTSATLADVRVDNTAPSAPALDDPGTLLRGTVALSATAADAGSGIASWTVQHSPAGGGTWTTACTDSTAPWAACSWATTGVADGLYDLRAVTRDVAGNETVSSIRSNVRVDNTAPAGSAVEAGDGDGGAGVLGAGDWIRFTWTEPVAPAGVLAGWDGSPVAVRIEVVDRNSKDEMDFWDGAGATRLNLITDKSDLKLNANYVAATAWLEGTMTRSGSAISVTLGAKLSGTLSTAGSGTMSWRPSALVKDLAGNPAGTVPVTKAGGVDVDF